MGTARSVTVRLGGRSYITRGGMRALVTLAAHSGGMTDPLRARQMLREYREAYERANRARIDSPKFRAAMDEVQRLAAELGSVGVDPASSWRESTKRKLRVPVPARTARARRATEA